MSCNLICTWENQKEIRPLPVGFDKYFDTLAEQVQTVDLKKLLGIEFYNDICANLDSTDTKYTNLLNGCEFTIGNYTYKSDGLRTFLAHLIASEWQISGKLHETAAGLIIKSNQDYEQVSFAAQKQQQNQIREFAFTIWTEIDRFLCNNSTIYTLYKVNSRQNSIYKPQISKIG